MTSLHGHGSSPGFFHMSNLGTYAELLGLDPNELLHQATVFRSLVAFQPWERREGYKNEAFRALPGSSLRLGALQSTSIYVPFRRFCSRCAASDRSKYGWPYWHVSHNLPGVSFCSTHDVRLRQTQFFTRSGGRHWNYMLPGEGESHLPKRSRTDFESELNRLALAVHADEFPPALSPLSIWHYRLGLETSGLVSANRHVNAAKAARWVSVFTKGVPSCMGLVQNDPRLLWVGPLMRPQGQSPHPAFKHMVVQAALACTPPPAAYKLDHKSTGMPMHDVRDLDAEKSKELNLRIRQLVKTGSRFTLLSLLEEIGIRSKFLHSRARFPRVKKVIERHRRALIQSRALQSPKSPSKAARPL